MSRRLGYDPTPHRPRRRTRHKFWAAFVGGFVVGFVLAWFTLAAWGDPILDGVRGAWDSIGGPPPTEQEVRDRYREIHDWPKEGLDGLPDSSFHVCPGKLKTWNKEAALEELRQQHPSLKISYGGATLDALLALGDNGAAMAYLADLEDAIEHSAKQREC